MNSLIKIKLKNTQLVRIEMKARKNVLVVNYIYINKLWFHAKTLGSGDILAQNWKK